MDTPFTAHNSGASFNTLWWDQSWGVYSFLTVTNLVLVITFASGIFSGLDAQPDNVMISAKVRYLMKLSLSYKVVG